MSYIRWKPQQPPGSSRWQYFPLAVIAFMSVVVAVNAGMVYAALHSFPGAAGDDESFALSNHYDLVLEHARQEAALGWSVRAEADDARRAVVLLTDRAGEPLHGASLTGTAERPLGAPQTRALTFREASAGHYVADGALPIAGQWELTLSAMADGHEMAVTRRVIVR